MTSIEEFATERLWRLWDADARIVGQWSKKPALSEISEGQTLTVDHAGQRTAWVLEKGQLVDPAELVKAFTMAPNPLLPNDVLLEEKP